MSLIKCPECDHEVSSKAPSCPCCGVTIAGNVKRCPVCKRFLLMDDSECPACHTRFILTQPQQPTPAPVATTTDTRKKENPQSEVKPIAAPLFTAPTSEVKSEQPQAEVVAATDETPATDTSASVPPKDETPAPPRRRRRVWPWLLLLLANIIVAAIGGLYWLQQDRHKAEERDYLMLQDCNDPAYFDDFLCRYPDSDHAADVARRLSDILTEDSLWHNLTADTPNRDSLQLFIDQHPSSPHLAAALATIDSLDWQQADLQGSVAAYDSYIAQHPRGNYIAQALTAQENSRIREERARRDSIAAAADSLVEVQVDNVPGAR